MQFFFLSDGYKFSSELRRIIQKPGPQQDPIDIPCFYFFPYSFYSWLIVQFYCWNNLLLNYASFLSIETGSNCSIYFTRESKEHLSLQLQHTVY